jgi:hypothetical protein
MNDNPDPSQLLTRKQAADYLRNMRCSITAAGTLAQMARRGNGPPSYRDGGRVLYDRAELDEWRRKRLRRLAMA